MLYLKEPIHFDGLAFFLQKIQLYGILINWIKGNNTKTASALWKMQFWWLKKYR